MTELKPCPFCGALPMVKYGKQLIPHFYIKCRNLDCDVCAVGNTQEEASKKWNKRPNPWHTGTPTEEGLYLIAFKFSGKNEYEVRELYLHPLDGLTFGVRRDIVAWMPIEPYKDASK